MLKWINKKRNKKGFTLVELVVVIAILGVLAAIAVPRLTKQTSSAKLVADKATARNIVGALNVAVADGKAEIKNKGVYFEDADGKISTTASTDIIEDLKKLNLLDDVGEAQTGGSFLVTIGDQDVVQVGISGDETKFYPVK